MLACAVCVEGDTEAFLVVFLESGNVGFHGVEGGNGDGDFLGGERFVVR